MQQEKTHLLAKLVEAEMDGAEAVRQVSLLQDTITQMKQVSDLHSSRPEFSLFLYWLHL